MNKWLLLNKRQGSHIRTPGLGEGTGTRATCSHLLVPEWMDLKLQAVASITGNTPSCGREADLQRAPLGCHVGKITSARGRKLIW